MAEAVPLIIKVLSKSMDTSLAPDKVELSTVTRDAATGEVRAGMAVQGAGLGRVRMDGTCPCHMTPRVCRMAACL